MKIVFSFLFLSLFAFQVNAQPAQRRAAKEKKQEVKSTPKKAATEAKSEVKPETKPATKPATPPTTPKKVAVAPPKKPTTASAKTATKPANGITTRAQLSYPTSMQMKEDVVWRRDIYREIDLTKGDNAGLYYPVDLSAVR